MIRIDKFKRHGWNQIASNVRRIDDRLHADDVVHQSLGDRLLHGRNS